jgi:chorismate mutase/prephenate dehydrogenase
MSESLDALRARIDALDHDLLALLARRRALVADVAQWKRRHHYPIRDADRERAVLADRRARALALDLPTGEVDALFRLLLRASRDQQAVLRAEMPLEVDARQIVIVGGRGRMGRVLSAMFGDLGHGVHALDLDDAPEDRAARLVAADVVVIAVPIADTLSVIDGVGPYVREDGLLMDITSVKSAPLARMLERTSASVIGTHPMFGPGVHSLQGQRVVLCAGRGDTWAAWVRQQLLASGLVLTECSAEQHDRLMAVVQVLTHFQTQVFGATLARLGLPLSESLRVTSPAYLLELYVAARHFAQDPRLYGPIEMLNPRSAEVTRAFAETAAEVASIVASGDQPAFDALFADVRSFFGAFTDEAVEQSQHLIDRIVEHS